MRLRASMFVVFALILVGSMRASAQQPESHFFTASDGARIHYLTAGTEGSWVVLLHGYTDSARRMWFTTGIAPALAGNHRVVAIDHLNHGQSDRPEVGGVGRISDVVELMDRLGIERAHIHGYSMGGAMVATLLYEYPERFITAGFGGSGVRETDLERNAFAASFDRSAPAAAGRAGGAGGADAAAPAAAARAGGAAAGARGAAGAGPVAGGGVTGAAAGARAGGAAVAATPGAVAAAGRGGVAPATGRGGAPGGGLAVFSRPLDLTQLSIPIIAINGEFDAPYAKTMRLWREVEVFHNVVLPGHTHFTAIAVGGPMPQQYIESMVGFIAAYDRK